VIRPAELERLQGLIAESGTDGWLLFDFRGRNPIASAVLGGEIDEGFGPQRGGPHPAQ